MNFVVITNYLLRALMKGYFVLFCCGITIIMVSSVLTLEAL